MSSNVVGLRIMDVVIGRAGGWPGEPAWTDPTKAYIRSPYVFDYGSPIGQITYNNLPAIPLPSNPSNAPVYVTLQDSLKDGQAAVFADLTTTRWNNNAFVRVGVVIQGQSVTPWDFPTMGASGPNHSPGIAPDPGSSAGSTRFLREDATWQTPSGSGFANPMTTAGDIITGGTGGAAQRLPVGSNGQVLTVNAGVPAWEPAASGISGSGTANNIPVFTGSAAVGNSSLTDNGTTVSTTEPFAAVSVTLPAGSVIEENFGSITLISSTAFLILGNASATLAWLTLQQTRASTFAQRNTALGTPGLVPMYGTPIDLQGQTAALSASNVFASAPTGLYRISLYIVVTTGGVSGTISGKVTFTDESGSQTITIATTAGVSVGNLAQGVAVIRNNASANIQISTTFNTVVGSPAYSIYAVCEQLMNS